MRSPDLANKVRDELEVLRDQVDSGKITRAQFVVRSTRLIEKLKKLQPRRQRVALT